MGRIQFNIAGLMGLVVLAAVGLAALRNLPSPLASLLVGLYLGLIFSAGVVAIAWKGRSRAIAAGYAEWSWAFLALVIAVPWIAGLMGLFFLAVIGLAALWNRPAPLAEFLFELAFGLNFAAVVVAIAMKGRSRAIAAGCAAGGWGYLVLVTAVPRLNSFVRNNLITVIFNGRISPGPSLVLSLYQVIAHSLFGIAAGVAGGLVALSLTLRSADTDRPTTNTIGRP